MNEIAGDISSWIKMIGYALFSGVAGFVGYLFREVDSDRKPKWSNALLQFAGSSIAGALVYLACLSMHLSSEVTGVVVGVSGWLGASATIQLLDKWVKDRLKIGDDK